MNKLLTHNLAAFLLGVYTTIVFWLGAWLSPHLLLESLFIPALMVSTGLWMLLALYLTRKVWTTPLLALAQQQQFKDNIISKVYTSPIAARMAKQKSVEKILFEVICMLSEGTLSVDKIQHMEEGPWKELLLKMHLKSEEIAKNDAQKEWVTANTMEIDSILRSNLQVDESELSRLVISAVCKNLDANQGAIFLTDVHRPDRIYMSACYAYSRQKYFKRELQMGEGMVGQCIKDGEPMFLTDIPQDYVHIESGLGHANPTCLFIAPIVSNSQVFGCMEFAFFRVLELHERDFLLRISEHFGTSLSSLRSKYEMKVLLEKSQSIAQDLTAKEEILIQNEEKLKAAQETLNQKLVELMAETNLTKSILSAIDKSNACIQFDMNGNILDANQMFLSIMGYERENIIGKSERIFIPEDEIKSDRYKLLWIGLREGRFNAGEFRRKTSSGKEVWMNVTYNPILDLQNKPYKVLMFANFTTEQKEKEQEYKSKIQAYSEAMGMLELTPHFQIRSANPYLLEKLQLKRKDLKGKSLFELLAGLGLNQEVVNELEIEIIRNKASKRTIRINSTLGENLTFQIVLKAQNGLEGPSLGYYMIWYQL